MNLTTIFEFSTLDNPNKQIGSDSIYRCYTQIVKLPISCIGQTNCTMRVMGNCIVHFME